MKYIRVCSNGQWAWFETENYTCDAKYREESEILEKDPPLWSVLNGRMFKLLTRGEDRPHSFPYRRAVSNTMGNQTAPRGCYTVKEAAKILGCKENIIRNKMREGKILYCQPVSSRKYPLIESVEAALEPVESTDSFVARAIEARKRNNASWAIAETFGVQRPDRSKKKNQAKEKKS